MKKQEPQEKKFRQLSDQELEKVTGGGKQKFDRKKDNDCTPISHCPNGWTTGTNGCPKCN